MQNGQTIVPAKPWEQGGQTRTVVDRNKLSREVQELIGSLFAEDGKDEG